jgi:2-amino-4-hydroxy-6-hydroxymethyldihydropteridine diphosphokinase
VTTTAYLSLGSNLGDRLATLSAAYQALIAHPQVSVRGPQSRSRLFETAPIGGPRGQGPFLNVALQIQTTLSAKALLNYYLNIEARFGRERIIRWDARTLDIDLLLYGDEVVAKHGLKIPHPRMHLRRFVLVPLVEIAGHVIHPTLQRPLNHILSELSVSPGDVYCVSDDWTHSD